MAYGNVYNENGKKVEVDDAWDCGFNFKKGTGIYYLEVNLPSHMILNVEPMK